MRYLKDSGSSMRFEDLLAGMSPTLQQRYLRDILPGGANTITVEERDRLLLRLADMRVAMRGYFAEHQLSALAYPPTLAAALPIGADVETQIGGQTVPLYEVMSRNIAHGSGVGMACLVLPAGLTREGLPVGIGFDMLPGQDEQLLSLGLTLETVLGPIPPPPPGAAEARGTS
jgi:mandelamide amidase